MNETIQGIVDGLTDNVIAIVVIAPAVYMAVNQLAMPEWYIGATGLVLGYYFNKRE